LRFLKCSGQTEVSTSTLIEKTAPHAGVGYRAYYWRSPEDALAEIRDDRLFALFLQRAYGLLVLGKKGLLTVEHQ
jgi:hypothetical protein